MSDVKQKPSAWIVIECGCRAPDDCEDYEVLVSVEDIGNYQKHIDHGRAYPLYDHPVTLDQAKQVLAEAGMAAVPLEPTEAMRKIGKERVDLISGCSGAHDEPCDYCGDGFKHPDGCGHVAVAAYKAMIAAQDKPDA